MAVATDAGGARRLEGWIDAHHGELHGHLTGMLGDPDEAEDVLQEVWLTAHRSPPGEVPASGPRAWLYRVATRAALDRLARRRRRTDLLDRHGAELEPTRAPRPDELLDGPSEALRERVRSRVAALPRKQREAVWLRWIEGRDYGSVAETIESTPAAARANVYQGLKKLRTELSGLWGEEAGA